MNKASFIFLKSGEININFMSFLMNVIFEDLTIVSKDQETGHVTYISGVVFSAIRVTKIHS